MAKRDYYEVLGVGKAAGLDEIKKAYRKLAIRFHPDKNPGDKSAESSFKEATEAYDVLSDSNKRQTYDQYGFAGIDGMGATSQDFSHVFRDFEDVFGDFGGIFDSLFGGSRQRSSGARSGGNRGDDLRYDIEISFSDAVFGIGKEISFSVHESCDGCNGSGAEGGNSRRVCPVCSGSGQVRRSSGFFSIASTCSNCNGQGDVIENPCRICRGSGRRGRNRRLKISIPSGIESGKRMRISGQGDASKGAGMSGDLYVYIQVKPDKFFERHENDLYYMIRVGVVQAALGAEIVVPTLDGKKIKVKVPPGTQNGKLLRLRNEGVPHLNDHSRRGDLYIKMIVRVPEKLSSKARNLLKELSEAVKEDKEPQPVPLSEID